ncbi:RidA family protein [Taklimakanibacter lacteus]|uniref:RidA family protein n=1 Tax=Taklimakanibacter lacteus TaxID=2268456 RepID=UPI000E66D384
MLKQIETDLAPKPFSNYAQAVEIAPGARYMFVAGQVGADTSGNIPESPEAQHRLAWGNVLAILKAAGMDHRNIVDARVFITDRSQIGLYRQVRDEVLKGHRAAATLLVVAGLADPRLVVEVTVIAAAPGR